MPARVVGMSARCPHRRALSAPTRVVDTSARYIPLAVSTTPSRCQRPPHGADNTRPYRQRALELAPGPGTLRTRPTTRVHTRGSTRTRAGRAADTIDVDAIDHAHYPGGAPSPGPGALRTRSTWTRPTAPTARGHARTRARPRRTAPDRAPPPRSTHTRTPIHETRTAHKGGIKPLCAAQCCPIPSLVCDTSGHGHRKRTERRSRPTNQRRTRTSKPANPRRKRRLTAWVPPAPPGEPHPHHLGSRAHTAWGPAPAHLRRNPWAPQAAAGGAAPPGEPRPHRRPTAVASPRGAGRRCHP